MVESTGSTASDRTVSSAENLPDASRRPHLGWKAVIYPSARIIHPEDLQLGDHSSIDDFVFLNAGGGTVIGRYVHIACHVSVIGGGGLDVGDYAVLATGSRVLTATDSFEGAARMSTHLPDEHRCVRSARVTIGRDAFVGANAVVMPGVHLAEGAVAGAGSVVTTDLEAWTVYTGVPARPRGARPRPPIPGP
ncbi:MAG: acyltransferase [Actinomycetota bacterium]|jgi:acetyltransferase-like isoleucine patch superfamily enzyme|nr:acyltransferase [Actinomycetota bacterium]